MLAETEEGWYTDPYSRHEARWFSEGKPTKLVRDAGVEAYDEPPDSPPRQAPQRIEEVEGESVGGGDLLRAEDAWGDNSSFRPSLGDLFLASPPPPGRGLPEAGVPPQHHNREIEGITAIGGPAKTGDRRNVPAVGDSLRPVERLDHGREVGPRIIRVDQRPTRVPRWPGRYARRRPVSVGESDSQPDVLAGQRRSEPSRM